LLYNEKKRRRENEIRVGGSGHAPNGMGATFSHAELRIQPCYQRHFLDSGFFFTASGYSLPTKK